MCPICLAAAAQIVVGTVSTSGVAAIIINRFRVKIGEGKTEKKIGEGRMKHEQQSNRESESRLAS